jgi:hypothetical protein
MVGQYKQLLMHYSRYLQKRFLMKNHVLTRIMGLIRLYNKLSGVRKRKKRIRKNYSRGL